MSPPTLARNLALVLACLGAPATPALAQEPVAAPTLEARAVLPADVFAPGPPSGAALGTAPINGRTAPFPSQPVQGFSAVLPGERRGTYLVLADNGFGMKENSADFLLRLYHLRPDFRRGEYRTGTIGVEGHVALRDPFRRIPFPIVREATPDRLLTGADLDPESVRRDAEGDLWIGDEFGPFLLHTDDRGRVLEAPVALPGVKSPQNPTLAAGETPTLPRSGGFEGTALSRDGTRLYAALELARTDDPDPRRRWINEYDLASGAFTDTRFGYRTEAPEHAVADLTALDANRLLAIERDNLQGPAAAFKRLYVIDLDRTDAEGFVAKREVADLLRIRDPALISLPAREGDLGLGADFSFPFQTVESVLPVGSERVLVVNDNNYPFSAGRNAGRPDDTEAIVLRVPGLRDP